MQQHTCGCVWAPGDSLRDVQATKQPLKQQCYPYPFDIVVNTREHSSVGNSRRYGFLPFVCLQTVDKKSTRLFDAIELLAPKSGERIDHYFKRLSEELQRRHNNGELIG